MYLYNVPTSMYVIPKRDSYLQYLRLRNLYNLIQFYIDLIIRMNANNCIDTHIICHLNSAIIIQIIRFNCMHN